MSNNRFWDDEAPINPRLLEMDQGDAGDVPPTAAELAAFRAAQGGEQDFVDEVLDEGEPQSALQQELNPVLMRIQMAKLYEMLITHQLISPGSADPAIVRKVQEEAKAFFMGRLKNLLGISKDGEGVVVQSNVKIPFNTEQVDALKALADRLIEKSKSPAPGSTPQLMPLNAPKAPKPTPAPRRDVPTKDYVQSAVTPVGAPQQVQRQVTRVRRTPEPVQAAPQVEQGIVKTRQKKVPGKVPARAQPLPMPTQAHMDALNAQQVENNVGGGATAGLIKQFTK